MISDFVSAWETLFGVYTPIQVLDNGTVIDTMTDWGYVMRTAFFIMVTYCILKLLGGVLNRDRKR